MPHARYRAAPLPEPAGGVAALAAMTERGPDTLFRPGDVFDSLEVAGVGTVVEILDRFGLGD